MQGSTHACALTLLLPLRLQDSSITTTDLDLFPSLQCLTLEYQAELQPGLASPPHAAAGLQVFRLSGWHVEMRALAPALQQLTGLSSLQLQHSRMGPAGMAALAPALWHLTRLSILDTNDCSLGPAGMAELSPCLQQLTGLQKL